MADHRGPDDAATVTIPASRGRYVTLSTDGYDGVNPYLCTFTPTGQGHRVTEMGVGGVSGVGRPGPVTKALIDGLKAVTEQRMDVAAVSGDGPIWLLAPTTSRRSVCARTEPSDSVANRHAVLAARAHPPALQGAPDPIFKGQTGGQASDWSG